MRHYRMDALQEIGDRLYLHGEPYAGIAYEVRGDHVVAIFRVVGGLLVGPASPWDPDRPRVLTQALLPRDPNDSDTSQPDAGDYYNGIPFEGVAYSFDCESGMLLEETDFAPGGYSRQWFPSGQLSSEIGRTGADGTRESVAYDESGRVISVRLDHAEWTVTDENRLRTLVLKSGFSENILDRIPIRVDSRLFLAGDGIADGTVERLDGLERIEHLTLNQTTITPRGLAKFSVCSKLRELMTRSNSGFTDEDVHNLLNHLPECQWEQR